MTDDENRTGASQNPGARAEFVTSLGRRVETLREALGALRAEPFRRERRDNFLRRVHAMSAAARVLGFASVADTLARVETALGQSAEVTAPEFSGIDDTLRGLPQLASGAALDVEPLPDSRIPDSTRAFPLSVLVYGDVALASAFEPRRGHAAIECECLDDPRKLHELARTLGPDAVILDGERRDAGEVVAALGRDPLIEPMPIIVVGSLNPRVRAALLNSGATAILDKSTSPTALREHVIRLTTPAEPGVEGPLGSLSVEKLAEFCAEAVRAGIVKAARSDVATTEVDLGDGHEVMAAIWGAVARVREAVTQASEGRVRFDPVGPAGTYALARWVEPDARVDSRAFGTASEAPGVNLEGRTVVVVDDDPAVVWFLAGVLTNAGASVLEAHNGELALELIRTQWPDLVISDVLMPGRDGLSLCREVKQDVAVRDIPVILISWKEDLLQRLRELGADADAYLRKEAESSSVVQRVRLVMRRRARVEHRLAAAGEVRGRLDGLTPRLILELVCRAKPNSRLSIRDAVYLYEIRIRDGAPARATRTAPNGSVEQGLQVLAALLGVSAGRFVVTPEAGGGVRDFSGSLREVLEPAISHARLAQSQLKAECLLRVESVDIDRPQVEAYLAAAPGPASGLVQRVLEGISPQQLILEGVSPLLLEAALQDLARRGAVRSVVSRQTAMPSVVPPAPLQTAESLLPEDYQEVFDGLSVSPSASELFGSSSDIIPGPPRSAFSFDLLTTGTQPPVEVRELNEPSGETAQAQISDLDLSPFPESAALSVNEPESEKAYVSSILPDSTEIVPGPHASFANAGLPPAESSDDEGDSNKGSTAEPPSADERDAEAAAALKPSRSISLAPAADAVASGSLAAGAVGLDQAVSLLAGSPEPPTTRASIEEQRRRLFENADSDDEWALAALTDAFDDPGPNAAPVQDPSPEEAVPVHAAPKAITKIGIPFAIIPENAAPQAGASADPEPKPAEQKTRLAIPNPLRSADAVDTNAPDPAGDAASSVNSDVATAASVAAAAAGDAPPPTFHSALVEAGLVPAPLAPEAAAESAEPFASVGGGFEVARMIPVIHGDGPQFSNAIAQRSAPLRRPVLATDFDEESSDVFDGYEAPSAPYLELGAAGTGLLGMPPIPESSPPPKPAPAQQPPPIPASEPPPARTSDPEPAPATARSTASSSDEPPPPEGSSSPPASTSQPPNEGAVSSSPPARSSAATARRAEGQVSTVKLMLAMAASFAFMFFGVRYLLTPEVPASDAAFSDDPSLAAVDSPEPAASSSPAPASAAPAAPTIESGLDIPSDVPVPDGKGLLEVVTPGRHFIYVDDVFVGRGPRRLLTLDPGNHQVQVRLAGQPRVFAATVERARRTLLTTPAD